jgi:hypothetical protein
VPAWLVEYEEWELRELTKPDSEVEREGTSGSVEQPRAEPVPWILAVQLDLSEVP